MSLVPKLLTQRYGRLKNPLQQSLRVSQWGGGSSLLTNLVAYYKFADANDSHTNALNLTEVNSPTYVAGQVENCVNLVGASSQYLSSASAEFAVGANSAWWSCWVRITATGGSQVIHAKHSPTTGQYGWVLYTNNGTPTFFGSDDGTNFTTATWGSALSINTWYHIYCQFDSTSKKLGISVNNGTLVESAALATGAIFATNAALQVGYNVNVALPNYVNGRIDEFAFGRGAVLTTTQRTNLYNAQAAGSGSYPFTGIP